MLLVDDGPGFADVAAEFVEREDGQFKTLTATSADEALEIVDRRDIDASVQ